MMNRIFKIVCLIITIFFAAQLQAQVKKQPVKKPAITAKKPIKKPVKKPAVKPTKAVADTIAKEAFTKVKISTNEGDIIIKLYNKTPQHRDNFIKLVKEHFYDSLLFHRVISQFMIQGGDPKSKASAAGEMLGMGDVGYTIPAEFDSSLYHKKGALCAARTENPEKASSGCQFYIVQGRNISEGELNNIEQQSGIKYSSAKRMTYKMKGGTPFLDRNYTVFGEVESGMEVIDSIAAEPVDNFKRPIKDIRMRMEILLPAEEKKEPKK
jgi:peptidyl-prolyl cis-trans isomerase B (cyclophilin B)